MKNIVSNSKCEIKIQYVNGSAFINTLHCSNHRTHEVDDIIRTYKHISKVATGSYGIIYIRDDEDRKHYNDFQVYVFKKGEYIQKDDVDLSPCIPNIEDSPANFDLPHQLNIH